ncbi:2-oxoglutarate dehydrogenase, E2 component, dihydrolipoamide succinyltransferase [Euzebya tangerina]|uniref:2-oxoglutarate dehydrogenase, E2 component, dihydrolipoamide succinyltransferase n=1 Tax=Euzebya tangerina TaxID=591198 RepID=UPI000E31EA56|nr:2-oxoglutarate dehydrogenase, E2 component, dihydrolipoamide succinyltransferase [Euzebya tangerina]
MATDVELPELGESVTEGTITAWLVEVGDTVDVDQPLFELSSDKIDTEVPSPVAGTVTEILVEVDETVEVGTVCVRIGDADEAGGSDGGSDDQSADEQSADDQSADSGQEAVAASEASGDEQAQAEAAAAEDSRADASSGGDSGGGDSGGGDSGGGDGVDVVLPELGESVTEGTITAWLVEVGDSVEEDQPLFELSSDKIDTEVPSPATGTVSEILVEVDETVEVGTVVARIGGSGSGSADGAEPAEEASDATAADQPDGATDSAEGTGTEAGYMSGTPDAGDRSGDGPSVAGSDALASPLVRKLAKEKGLDLDAMQGSGQGGRITREDVEAAESTGGEAQPASSQQAAASSATNADKPGGEPSAGSSTPPEAKKSEPAREPGERETVEDLSRIRQRIAEKMLESQGQAAQLTTVQEADVTALMAARTAHKEEFKSREGASLSPFAMVARAALMALKNHPLVNAYADWDNGKLYKRDYVNLGIAVDTPKGLLVPNIKNADGLTTAGLSRAISEAAQKARGTGGKRIDFSDIEGGTFTLTNTGSVGVLIDTPILNYPEVAILGVGAIKKRVAVVEAADGSESFGVRHMMYLSLTYDHRLLDGADAARYVTEVKQVLETTNWEQEVG